MFRWLFRVFLAGLVVLSFLDFGALSATLQRHYVAIPLWIAGFGAAFYLTGYLGWGNAFWRS